MHKLKITAFGVILIAFFIDFLIFNIYPTYMKSQKMNVYSVPAMKRVGDDLKFSIAYSYKICLYSPLTNVFFKIASKFYDKYIYCIVLLITIVSVFLYFYCIMPRLTYITDELKVFSLITLLFSLNFSFELERGQWNIIAFVLFMFAIYLANKNIWVAYLLAAILVHLKLYPLIFSILFIQDYYNLKKSIYKLIPFFIICFLLFFIQGFHSFISYCSVLRSLSGNWEGNHSIISYVTLAKFPYSAFIFLLGFYLIMLISILLIVHMRKTKSDQRIEPHVFIIVIIGSLIIPGLSHDYKLNLLALAMPFYFAHYWKDRNAVNLTLIAVISIFFFSTFYLYSNASYFPLFVQNKFPILICISILVYIQYIYNAYLINKEDQSGASN